MTQQTRLTLNNGIDIPIIGFGTWAVRGLSAVDTVLTALKAGYLHIDTASIYGNEDEVGQAVRQSGIPREEIFITSKVWNNNHGYDRTLRACDASLKRLGTDYVDLYLIHWPDGGKLQKTWQALEQLHNDGKARAIGVSNYHPKHLEPMLDYANLLPALNQIELHPWNYQRQHPTIDFCHRHNIVVQAYSPINQGRRLDHPTLQKLAQKYARSPAQIILRWDVQHRFITIPKSSTPERIHSNIDIFDFELSEEDMVAIDSI